MPPLRPIERRVLTLRLQGKTYEEMAPMFRRSPDMLRRIASYALLKVQQ